LLSDKGSVTANIRQR